MSLKFGVEVVGIEDAEATLDGIAHRAGDMTPALESIRAMFYRAERARFTTQGLGQWAPDLPSTVRRKAGKGQDLRTMRATGALYRSLTVPGAPGSVYRINQDGFEIGTNIAYAKWAQKTSGRRRRRVVVVTRPMRGRWVAKLRKWVREGKL